MFHMRNNKGNTFDCLDNILKDFYSNPYKYLYIKAHLTFYNSLLNYDKIYINLDLSLHLNIQDIFHLSIYIFFFQYQGKYNYQGHHNSLCNYPYKDKVYHSYSLSN